MPKQFPWEIPGKVSSHQELRDPCRVPKCREEIWHASVNKWEVCYKHFREKARDLDHALNRTPPPAVLRGHGLTEEDYENLLDFQEGKCALCGEPPGKRRLFIDHDHKCCPDSGSCGQCVRGLLCGGCNAKLGGFEAMDNEVTRGYLANPPGKNRKHARFSLGESAQNEMV